MHKASHIFAAAAIFTAASLVMSCDDTPNVGSSLVENTSEILAFDDFTVKGSTVINPYVQTRTVTEVLGTLSADGYGTFTSEFVAELMPASRIPTGGITLNQIDQLVDSAVMRFYVVKGSCVGDSLLPMGLEIYRLGKRLNTPINSSTPVNTEGLKLLGRKMYVCNTLGESDSIRKLGYVPIDIKINDEGALARELFSLYLTNPEAYQSPSLFANYFNGIYVRNSYGSGRVMGISSAMLTLHYHTNGVNDEGKPIINKHEGAFYAVTPEVILNNMITYTPDAKVEERLAAGENLLIAPVGRDVEMTFPIEEVISQYRNNAGHLAVINTLSLDIPAEAVENEYGIEPPENILMVLSSEKERFFRMSELTDGTTSFYATYDSTNHRYRFSGLRTYLLKMIEKQDAGTLTPADYTFTLTPVSVVQEQNSTSYYDTSTYLSAINPYIGTPVMARLDLSKAVVNFTFTKQNIY